MTVANPRLQADNTLDTENSEIQTIDEDNDRVIGGATRDTNLFHSFLEFNIEIGKGVYFANPAGIDNILARVTGDNISEIRGTLGVEGSADLYFINPNGLFFNQNASLDLNGSFFASTAEAILFDNFEYSAVNPTNIPLDLVVTVPTGLRFGANPGDIILQKEEPPQNIVEEIGDAGELLDTSQPVNDNTTPFPDGIQGELTGFSDTDTYQVYLEAGTTFDATTVGSTTVDTRLFSFNPEGLGISANDDSENTFQSTLPTLQVTESGTYYLSITSWANSPESNGGSIFGSFFITENPTGAGANLPLNNWTGFGFEEGGYIIQLNGGGNNSTPTGNLAVNPGQTLALIGGNVTVDGVEILSSGSNIQLGGLKESGIVTINPDLSVTFPQGIDRGNVTLSNSANVNVRDNSTGQGSININVHNLELTGGSGIKAGIGENLGSLDPQAGDIIIDATGNVNLDGRSVIANQVRENAQGNAGNIIIEAENINLTNFRCPGN